MEQDGELEKYVTGGFESWNNLILLYLPGGEGWYWYFSAVGEMLGEWPLRRAVGAKGMVGGIPGPPDRRHPLIFQ